MGMVKCNNILKFRTSSTQGEIVKHAKDIFDIQIKELQKVRDNITTEIESVIEVILGSKGKVIVTGVGKSGLIGEKIAATLASTGTCAIFMHATEGLHGDLGMIYPDDIVIAISNSGNSDEVISILPSIEKIGAKLIAMTGNKNSKLGKAADYVLNIGVEREACPMNLAPTCSTSSTLIMGDTLAIILMELKGFKPENFALYHPGGSLGRKLLTRVEDVMKKDIALAEQDAGMEEVVIKMSEKRLGVVCIIENEKMIGVITEGDIRRALSNKDKFFELKAKDIMTKDFTYILKEKQAMEALELMEDRENQISVLPVIEKEKVVGIVRIHDVLNIK